MAYFDETMKQVIEPAITALCKKYKVRAKLSINKKHDTVKLTIKRGKLALFGSDLKGQGCIQMSHYSPDVVPGEDANNFLFTAFAILNAGNYNKSPIPNAYCDPAFYVVVKIGTKTKPYAII
ncbi:hypothetical protein UFOVP116_236 [uncultured Caudovirales phage]|uniref:Uncharacterized protein n=1 Tax=uncultured Caudovirales phage TaxID=2100421 RepID=A0A6J5L9Q7_9CAUD|nr:hypothetical protein UFOVP116_236 [uncultured Caudovirales phage]